MIFKAKFSWNTKKEIIDELYHIIGLIEQNYPSGADWSLTGEEKISLAKEKLEEPLPDNN
jgi:hypothetical protein